MQWWCARVGGCTVLALEVLLGLLHTERSYLLQHDGVSLDRGAAGLRAVWPCQYSACAPYNQRVRLQCLVQAIARDLFTLGTVEFWDRSTLFVVPASDPRGFDDAVRPDNLTPWIDTSS